MSIQQKPDPPVKPHLLVSVYLSAQGLSFQRYRLGFAEEADNQYFRIERFLTGLNSLRAISWASICVYFETDEIWQHLKPEIAQKIAEIWPEAIVRSFRLDNRQQWEKASLVYEDSDIVYLHANDDHALVSLSSQNFDECVSMLVDHPEIQLGAVTHFPEMTAMLYRERFKHFKNSLSRVVEVGYALGTTLVRASFFKSWWRPGNFDETEIIVRPDNPLGNSVTFPNVKQYVPKAEVIRHLDGYSHVGLFKPLYPLRNVSRFREEQDSPSQITSWTRGYWPRNTFANNGVGIDLHLTQVPDSVGLLNQFQLGVARLQAGWALRISLLDASTLFNAGNKLDRLLFVPAVLVALITPPVARNILDYFADLPVLLFLSLASRFGIPCDGLVRDVWYFGSRRAFAKKFFTPKPMNPKGIEPHS